MGRAPHQKCKFHQHKKIEAFCETCLQTLCIECILKQDHKTHEMLSVEEASKRQLENFISKANSSQKLNWELDSQILRIQSHLNSIEESARQEREKISQVFTEVRQKIVEREQLLKKRISDALDTQQALYKQRIQNLKDQIRCIADAKSERDKIQAESDFMILQKSKLRQDLIVESSKEVPNYDLKNSIPEFNKENEIAIIVKLLLPKKLRPSLLSSTIVSQIRMT